MRLFLLVFVCLFLFSCENYKNDINYYDNGKIESKLIYRNNILFKRNKYFPSGKLYMEYYILDGKKNGTQKVFYENGHIQAIFDLLDDKIVGPVYMFNEDGSFFKIEYYKENKLLN